MAIGSLIRKALKSKLGKKLARRLCLACDVRFAGLELSRIGHQSAEPELFVKEGMLGLRKTHRLEILLAPSSAVANGHYMRYWKQFFCLVSDPQWCETLHFLAYDEKLRLPRSHYVEAVNYTADFPKILGAWGDRPPLLQLLPEDDKAGWQQLQQWGLREGDWFVCLHCREAGFIVDPIHDFRNASIENFLPAIKEITARGGWVVRMGDPTMAKLPPLPRVIDYAISPLKSQYLDIFLCARCRFFLGTSSGLSMVASAFGVPGALTNHAPISVTLAYAPCDIGIPKLVRTRQGGRTLTFSEWFASPVSNYRYNELYEKDGLEVLENTPDEILALCREMLERVEGRWKCTPEDEALQQSFKALFRDGHYSFGSRARVGKDFLRKHAGLLNLPQLAKQG